MSDTCLISERVAISSTHPSRPTTCHLGTDGRSQCECAAMVIWNGPCRQILRLIWAGFGISRAVLAVGRNVDLEVRPPHMHACERLHADYSDVQQVQHGEDSSTKCSRNDDSRVS